jgi:hypothetical protein
MRRASEALRWLGVAAGKQAERLRFGHGGVDPVLVDMLEEALAALPDADSPMRARVMAPRGCPPTVAAGGAGA